MQQRLPSVGEREALSTSSSGCGIQYVQQAMLSHVLRCGPHRSVRTDPSIPNHIVFIQDNDARIHQGSSLAALVELGQSKSYTLVATTTFNAIFVRDSDVHKLPHFDRSIDALHRPSMCTDVFQLYDGTLVFTGCKKLLWHRVSERVCCTHDANSHIHRLPWTRRSCKYYRRISESFRSHRQRVMK
jgi:hypothetical protein